MSRTLSTLLVTLFAGLVFHAAATEFRLTVFDETTLVGVGKVEVESEEIELELDLLRGLFGFFDLVVEAPGVEPVRYPASFGIDGLMVFVGDDLLDLATFAATFGQGQRLEIEVEFEDRLDRDDDDWDDDRYGRDDDDDDDWDDDRDGRDDDDDWDDDRSGRDDDDDDWDDDRDGRDDDDDDD